MKHEGFSSAGITTVRRWENGKANPDLALGKGTSELLQGFRQVVPFLDRDRPLTPDIQASYQFLRQLDDGS